MITIRQVSKDHSYILRGDEWLATTNNQDAELVRKAFEDREATIANGTVNQSTEEKT